MKRATAAFVAAAALPWGAAACAAPPPRRTNVADEPVATAPPGDRGACTAGDGLACERVGERYLAARRGLGAGPQRVDASWFAADRLLLRRACDEGAVAGACTGLAWTMTPGERAEEVRALGLGCRLGSVRGCASLGERYAAGDGVERDDKLAGELFAFACSRGHAASCGELGTLLAEGRGTAPNAVTAAQLHERACKAGVLRACGGLGRAYARGRGVERNEPMAVVLLATGCQAVDPGACLELAELLAAPGTSVHDEPRALEIASRTCDLGHAPACAAARRMREATTAERRAP